MSAPRRPVLRWFGGKWKLAPWIIAHFPAHRVYVEPFGGAASVLLRKEPSYAEIYNDLDDEVVNLFRILRDPETAELLRAQLALTPFARTEFNAAYEASADNVERARRMIVRSFMGFGADGATSPYRTGFRSNSTRSGTTPAHDWVTYAEALPLIISRMAEVVIENRSAIEVLGQHDAANTLHYVDPPYVHATRASKSRQPGSGTTGVYRHEMTDADHVALLEALMSLAGMVIVSGYPHALYDEMLADWHRVERQAMADGARARTEVLWINPLCRARWLDEQAQPDLLGGAA